VSAASRTTATADCGGLREKARMSDEKGDKNSDKNSDKISDKISDEKNQEDLFTSSRFCFSGIPLLRAR
jgi:hypothetical protein